MDIKGRNINSFILEAEEKNIPYRITNENGKSYMLTDDYNPLRYNLIIINDIIIDFYYG